MIAALLLGGAMNLWAYWFSDKMVLRMYNAREVDESTAPACIAWFASSQAVRRFDAAVYLIDEDQPNAFATGRNPENAAVAATTASCASSRSANCVRHGP